MARSAADLKLAFGLLAGADGPAARAWRLTLPGPRRQSLQEYRVGEPRRKGFKRHAENWKYISRTHNRHQIKYGPKAANPQLLLLLLLRCRTIILRLQGSLWRGKKRKSF